MFVEKQKKTQILLYDTGRRCDDFINKIKYRNLGKYDEVPHFMVTKIGTIYQLYDTNFYSRTFNDSVIDKQFIKVAIENLGWLTKNTITGFLSNWIGDLIGLNLLLEIGETTTIGIGILTNKSMPLQNCVTIYVIYMVLKKRLYHLKVILKILLISMEYRVNPIFQIFIQI